jgi:carbon monoxide dehydrogenase subunit G
MSIPTRLCFLPLLLAAQLACAQQPAGNGEVEVAVSRNGRAVEIRAAMTVAASAQQVWQVLTDYDHMAAFSPGLEKSRAVPLGANRLRVEQAGVARFGILRFPYESVREIELEPYREIRSRALAGTIKSGSALTRLVESGGATRIDYQSVSVPSVQLPFGLGMGTVAARTREQFIQLRAEIYRRMRDAK